MAEVWVDMTRLMEILDDHEGGSLYPLLTEEEQVIKVEVYQSGVRFIIGKPNSPDQRAIKESVS